MAKFKLSVKLQGLEVYVEGSREDVPLMTQAAGQQIAGLLMLGSDAIEGEFKDADTKVPLASEQPKQTTAKKRPPRKRHSSTNTNAVGANTAKDEVVEWVHDPSKWGSPQQDWVTADKAIWLLYVAGKEKGLSQLSARTISNTFNKLFRQSGEIKVFNISRDLGKLKTKPPASVSENATVNPVAWFLTNTGEKKAEELVKKALGQG